MTKHWFVQKCSKIREITEANFDCQLTNLFSSKSRYVFSKILQIFWFQNFSICFQFNSILYFYIFLNVFYSRGRPPSHVKLTESLTSNLAPGHSSAILLTLNDGHPSEYDDSRPNERNDDFWICSDCVGFKSD